MSWKQSIALIVLAAVIGSGSVVLLSSRNKPQDSTQPGRDQLLALAEDLAALTSDTPIANSPEPTIRRLGDENCLRGEFWQDYGTEGSFGDVVTLYSDWFRERGWERERVLAEDGTTTLVFSHADDESRMEVALIQLSAVNFPAAYELNFRYREQRC